MTKLERAGVKFIDNTYIAGEFVAATSLVPETAFLIYNSTSMGTDKAINYSRKIDKFYTERGSWNPSKMTSMGVDQVRLLSGSSDLAVVTAILAITLVGYDLGRRIIRRLHS